MRVVDKMFDIKSIDPIYQNLPHGKGKWGRGTTVGAHKIEQLFVGLKSGIIDNSPIGKATAPIAQAVSEKVQKSLYKRSPKVIAPLFQRINRVWRQRLAQHTSTNAFDDIFEYEVNKVLQTLFNSNKSFAIGGIGNVNLSDNILKEIEQNNNELIKRTLTNIKSTKLYDIPLAKSGKIDIQIPDKISLDQTIIGQVTTDLIPEVQAALDEMIGKNFSLKNYKSTTRDNFGIHFGSSIWMKAILGPLFYKNFPTPLKFYATGLAILEKNVKFENTQNKVATAFTWLRAIYEITGAGLSNGIVDYVIINIADNATSIHVYDVDDLIDKFVNAHRTVTKAQLAQGIRLNI